MCALFRRASSLQLRNVSSHDRWQFHSSISTFSTASLAAASFARPEEWKFSSKSRQKRCEQEARMTTGSLAEKKKASLKEVKVVSFPEKSELRVYLGDEMRTFDIAWLRDACPCHLCTDKSTTQKTFQSTDIPEDLQIRQIEKTPDGSIEITWKNDLPQYDKIKEHVSTYSYEFLLAAHRRHNVYEAYVNLPGVSKTRGLHLIDYKTFMETDRSLWSALKLLVVDGIIMIKDVPSAESSVELIAKRIGNLRDSLYGRTWDVRSIPEAKNVAYTSTFLGLHMDLLYMKDPPGLQLLHCLKNTCEGGAAIFSDSFHATKSLSSAHIKILATYKTAYHYRNNNENYYHEHATLEFENPDSEKPILKYVNWSPPFQANYPYVLGRVNPFPKLLEASRSFATVVQAPENIFRYEYEEGDCVIFNNRRILHGREAFQAEGGERWLRGAYVDTDVFHSRLRVLGEQFNDMENLMGSDNSLRDL